MRFAHFRNSETFRLRFEELHSQQQETALALEYPLSLSTLSMPLQENAP